MGQTTLEHTGSRARAWQTTLEQNVFVDLLLPQILLSTDRMSGFAIHASSLVEAQILLSTGKLAYFGWPAGIRFC